MKELRTKTHAFDCDYCVPVTNTPRPLLYIRVKSADMVRAVGAFDDPNELSELSFCGKPIRGYTRLQSFRNEGALSFFVLGE